MKGQGEVRMIHEKSLHLASAICPVLWQWCPNASHAVLSFPTLRSMEIDALDNSSAASIKSFAFENLISRIAEVHLRYHRVLLLLFSMYACTVAKLFYRRLHANFNALGPRAVRSLSSICCVVVLKTTECSRFVCL